jgi:hypothetical protein
MARKTIISALRGLFGEAEAALAREEAPPIRPAGDAQAWGYGTNEWPGYPERNLPPDCPVAPLGVDGQLAYFVDPLGQMIEVHARNRNDMVLNDLFKGATEYLHHHWAAWENPKGDQPGRWSTKKIETKLAWNCLVRACAQRGPFDPVFGVRGRGGWRVGAENLFVWHAGRKIYTVDGRGLRAATPGSIDGRYYALRPEIMAPWREPVPHDESPGRLLLEHLMTWRWERPLIDPLLLLGWMATAFYGGALDERPVLFTVGDKGVGKSSLHKFMAQLFGPALVASANTSAAGIYTRIRQDSLPVAVDEFESKPEDGGRAQSIIELARQAYSGSLALRGSSSLQNNSFALASSFVFSAINPPPMGNQDRSRMAVLNLERLDRASVAPRFALDPSVAGAMMLRRLMDGWAEMRRNLADWDETLRLAGFEPRARSTFGTLLAAAQTLVGEEALEAVGLPVTDQARVGQLVRDATAAELAAMGENWRDCLEHLFNSVIALWAGGEKPTVGDVLDRLDKGDIDMTIEQARRRLAAAGLGVQPGLRWTGRAGYVLFVPLKGPTLNLLFRDTIWRNGVWASALRQGPPPIVVRQPLAQPVGKINGTAAQCVLIDVTAYFDETHQADAQPAPAE